MPESYCLVDMLKRHFTEKRKYQSLSQKITISIVCFLITAISFSTYPAYGQMEVKTVEAVGTSVMNNTDVETAKQQAIANALVSALDKIITEILPVEQLTQNFRTIDTIVYGETDKYINDYKVLTEAISKKHYRVLIQAKVSVKRLRGRLATSGVMHVRKRRSQNIEIVVQGTRNLSNFINFRKGLKDVAGVNSIQVSDMQPDEAKLLVNFEGSLKEFTNALVHKTFDQFSIRIFEISETKLRVELIPG